MERTDFWLERSDWGRNDRKPIFGLVLFLYHVGLSCWLCRTLGDVLLSFLLRLIDA